MPIIVNVHTVFSEVVVNKQHYTNTACQPPFFERFLRTVNDNIKTLHTSFEKTFFEELQKKHDILENKVEQIAAELNSKLEQLQL